MTLGENAETIHGGHDNRFKDWCIVSTVGVDLSKGAVKNRRLDNGKNLYASYLFFWIGVLLLKVPEAIIRSGKCLLTRWKMAGKRAFEVNGFGVTSEILVQSKSLHIGAASYFASEDAVVCSGVLSVGY